MVNGVNIPAGARLQFNRPLGFEYTVGTGFDGGRVLFSANGGAFTSARSMVSGGAPYNGNMTGFWNPLINNTGFVRDSFGYTATQLDLSSLAGQNVRFGFEIGTDIGG